MSSNLTIQTMKTTLTKVSESQVRAEPTERILYRLKEDLGKYGSEVDRVMLDEITKRIRYTTKLVER